jgi:hypothetical protein
MKITIDRKVLEQALDALEKALPITREQLYAIISLREALAQPVAQPEKRETWLAIREGHLNAASDSYFTARPQLDSAVNRRIFYAGHSSGYGDEAPQPAAQQEHDPFLPTGARIARGMRALAAAQPTEPAGEPVAWDVYVAEHQRGYLIDSLDDPQYLDDATNHGAVVTPLYTRPAVQQEPAGEPVAHFGSAYVNENGVHITTVLGPVAIPQDAALYTRPAVPLSDDRIDRAIAELGLNYLADAANNRAVLRELCRKAAHKIGGAE